MQAYNPEDFDFNIDLNKQLLKLLCEAEEAYGEYKGFLKTLPFDYKLLLESFYNIDIFYSFKIDGLKESKENMFDYEYKNKDNTVLQFNNLKKCLLYSVAKMSNNEIKEEDINKLHKLSLSNCKKDSLTKKSGHYRKKQTYILKPGIAGSSVSFIPPKYNLIPKAMELLCRYVNESQDNPILTASLFHLQFERIHPYLTNNGKLGRLLMSVLISIQKKEPPILFISESMDNLKNTYFTLLSTSSQDDKYQFIKFILECVIEQCNKNIKKIKKITKVYNNDYEAFKTTIGGTTIFKIYPLIIKNIVFTTNDIVKQSGLHINSINKVLNKLVEAGYLHKEKKNGNNRVTFTYINMHKILTM